MEHNNYGNVREAYEKARHGFPEEVIHLIGSLVPRSSRVLDVGCGTGISTRQIDTLFDVVYGCDKDEGMIEFAQNYDDAISYVVAPAHTMPYEKEMFDAVTAFSAFHWFYDEESIAEIKRVLTKGGLFIAINKYSEGGFREEFLRQLKTILPPDFKFQKDKYNPSKILKEHGFTNVHKKTFHGVEEFTVDRALTRIQSMAYWNLVPKGKQKSFLNACKKYLERMAHNGMVDRNIKIEVVYGTK